MNINYTTIRHAYYIGIFLLVAYSLPAVKFIKEWLYPIFNFEITAGLPLISVIAILTGIGAFVAYKYRRLG